MQNAINKFERYISYVLIFIVIAYISFQTVELFWESYKAYSLRIQTAGLDYTQQYGKNVFVIFFNILLALEILETVRVFDKDHDIKIRIILLVCIIAVSRKILTLELHVDGPMNELALAGLVLSLALGYFLVFKSTRVEPEESGSTQNNQNTKSI